MPDPQYPGMLAPGNIDLTNRPMVKNPDGKISTVRSIGVNVDGRETVIPTVSDDGRLLSNDEAIDLYRRTGKHLGQFDTPENATSYGQQLHNDQAQLYGLAGPTASSGPPVGALDPNAQAALIANIRAGAMPPPQTDVPQGAFGSLAPMTR